jgi:methylmalonyl-CoA/ethylmalonyl-CoA epimerase
MKFKLDHIGLVVENIREFQKIVDVLDPERVTDPTVNPSQKVSASFVGVDEDQKVYIELLEPAAQNSPITNFLKKGGGLHHLCFEVENIEEASAKLKEAGFRLIVPPEDCPAYDVNLSRECRGVTKIAFFMLSREFLIELIEKGV